MLKEAVEALDCKEGLVYIDGTLGGGGHSFEIAKRIGEKSTLIGLDIDGEAIKAASEKLKDFKNLKILKESYTKIPEVLKNLNISKITGGLLLDVGASYHQLTSKDRGFSFKEDAKLDMRFDKNQNKTAYDVVNTYKEAELVRIFSEYGEERFSKRIAKKIVQRRSIKPIETTKELADLIVSAVPKTNQKIHPATRVFQALRIEVNNEIENIKDTLIKVISLLEKNAKIVVISFHSLEDRVVKNIFRECSKSCRCANNEPICKCKGPILEIITKKPILPSEEEIQDNPPSRSAKMRVARVI